MMRGMIHRTPPRLFVGKLSVAGKGSLVRQLESLSSAVPSNMDRALLGDLGDVLALPSVDTAGSLQPSDLAFDVVLQGYRFGSTGDLSLGSGGIPLYWRPQVRLAARLYHPVSNKTKKTITLDRSMSWGEYFRRVLSWRVLAGLEPPAGRGDMQHLLQQAGKELVTRLERAA
jgi:hypothetical protein